jgi:exopolysaccharide biosynthesis polyprenyl glycosylphosphotransferase
MKNSATLVYNLFLAVGDFLALLLAFVGAYVLRVTIDDRPIAVAVPSKTYFLVFLALLPFWIIIFGLLGLYNSNIYEKRFSELGRLFVGSFIGMLFVVFWNFLAPEPILPARLVPIYGLVLAFIFLVIFRNLARFIRIRLFHFSKGLTNVLIVGNTRLAKELVELLANSQQSGYRVVGVVGNKHRLSEKYSDIKVYNTFSEATKEIGQHNIYTIIQTELYADEERNREVLEFAQTHHIGYRFSPGNSELFVGKLDVELFRSSLPMIAVHQTALFGWGRIVKRLFDLVVGGLLLLIALPFMFIIAILIKLTSRGPVFFRQTRLTRYDKKFRVFKFRTLKVKYNGLSPEEGFAKMGKPELAKTYRENGDYIPNDPRFTRLGRIIRQASLDELPQLFNVLKGDLSLVGPRALVPEELDKHERRHAILSVKSGLTGLAQVSGRKNISYEERRQLDVYYVQNWSFWMDLVILVKTFKAVITGSGAK